MISELLNFYIREGIFPTFLKAGRVILIFKSGITDQLKKTIDQLQHYVFLLKFFENLVHQQMIDFINKFNILSSNQFWFTPDHNTSDALLEFIDNACEAISKNKLLLAIFLDFSKAFDTVKH